MAFSYSISPNHFVALRGGSHHVATTGSLLLFDPLTYASSYLLLFQLVQLLKFLRLELPEGIQIPMDQAVCVLNYLET